MRMTFFANLGSRTLSAPRTMIRDRSRHRDGHIHACDRRRDDLRFYKSDKGAFTGSQSTEPAHHTYVFTCSTARTSLFCVQISQVPYFNAPMYLQNKSSIGKVDEILGPINQVYFTIKPSEGIQATSFKEGDKVYIAGDKLLPLERFLPKPKPAPGTKGSNVRIADETVH